MLSEYDMENKVSYAIRLWHVKITCATLSEYGIDKHLVYVIRLWYWKNRRAT